MFMCIIFHQAVVKNTDTPVLRLRLHKKLCYWERLWFGANKGKWNQKQWNVHEWPVDGTWVIIIDFYWLVFYSLHKEYIFIFSWFHFLFIYLYLWSHYSLYCIFKWHHCHILIVQDVLKQKRMSKAWRCLLGVVHNKSIVGSSKVQPKDVVFQCGSISSKCSHC